MELAVEGGAFVGAKLGPVVDGTGPGGIEGARGVGVGDVRGDGGFAVALEALGKRGRGGGEAAAFEVGEGGGVGGDHAGAGTGFDAHVADRHAAFHGEGADGGAGVLDDVAGGAGGADLPDDVEDDVLGGDAVGEGAIDV